MRLRAVTATAIVLCALGSPPVLAGPADPGATATTGASAPGAAPRQDRDERLPRGLLITLAVLAGAGAMTSLGAASASLQAPRPREYDRFIDPPR